MLCEGDGCGFVEIEWVCAMRQYRIRNTGPVGVVVTLRGLSGLASLTIGPGDTRLIEDIAEFEHPYTARLVGPQS